MSTPEKTDLHRLQLQLAALDSLELAFLYVDPSGSPAFLSSRAAAILFIRDRSAIDEHLEILEPLLKVGRALTGVAQARKFTDATVNNRFEELEVRTADDRPVKILAYVRNFQVPIQGRTLNENAGSVVIFYDVTPLEPFFATLDECRRARSLVALAASSLGRPLMLAGDEKAFESSSPVAAAAENPDASVKRVASPLTSSDIAAALSTAVDIVDPLIPQTHRLVVEAGTPVLVAISETDVLRLLTLLLFESVDFGGPFGRTRVKPFLQRRGEEATSPFEVQVLILGQRGPEITEAGPLETYLYRRYLPGDYRVMVFDDLEAPSNGNSGLGSEVESFISRNASREELQVNQGAIVIPEESHSENARLAASIAKRLGVTLQMKLLNQKMLALSFRVPLANALATSKLSATRN